MRTRIKATLILLSGIFIAGAYWLLHERTPKPIVVAIDAPIVNKRIFDPSDMDAARLYFEETNDSRLTVVKSYYHLNADASKLGFEAALKDGVQFFITTQPSFMLVRSAHMFEDTQALILNTSATSPVMTAKDDYMLRIIPDGEVEQSAIAAFINQLEGTRLLILQDAANAAYTDPAYEFFIGELERLGRWHVTHEKFVFDKFSPESLRPVVEQPFDALYLLAGEFQLSTGNIAQLFHGYHPNAPIILTPWARSDAIFEAAGPALEKMILLGHHRAQSDDAAIADYLSRFRQRFGYQPMAMALHIRQSLELLEQAFAAGHTTPSAARDYLLTQPIIETSLGPISFDSFGDVNSPLFPIDDLSSELRPEP